MNFMIILLMGFIGLCAVPSYTDASCSSSRPIRRVYVIRRSLRIKFITIIRNCHLAHSGLILEMTDGKQCVLEYMGDEQSHLYDASPSSTSNCWWGRSCVKLKMSDDQGDSHTWTRQKRGTAFPSRLSVTPQAAKRKMQSLMGSNYQLWRNNCHLAQERLRRSWGLTVSQSYSDPKTVCTCIGRFWYLLPRTGILGLIRNFCKV